MNISKKKLILLVMVGLSTLFITIAYSAVVGFVVTLSNNEIPEERIDELYR